MGCAQSRDRGKSGTDFLGLFIRRFATHGKPARVCFFPGAESAFPPRCVAVPPEGNEVFVTDATNHRIVVFYIDGTYKYEFGTKGSAVGQFDEPGGLCFSSDGMRLYVCDRNNKRLQVFTRDGKFLREIGGRAQQPRITLSAPVSVVASPINDEIYVSDYMADNPVSVFSDTDGHLIRQFTRAQTSAALTSLAISPDGLHLFATDNASTGIRRYAAADGREILPAFGGFGSANQQFRDPRGIAVSKDSKYIFVGDVWNNRVQQLRASDGAFVMALGGPNGEAEYNKFNMPMDLCLLPDGHLLVADQDNCRIQVLH